LKVLLKDYMQKNLLETQHVSVQYGGVNALDDVSVVIGEGEIVALMGPNGAGKSTVIKSMFGLAPIASGEVLLHGEPYVPIPHNIVHKSVSYVPQGRRVFTHLSVEENLEIGGYIVKDKSLVKDRIAAAYDLFPDLKAKRDKYSGTLSGGQQQMLAIARGLMTDPKVLLLDEPSLGLAPKIVKEVFELVSKINEERHTAILIVEHNLQSLLPIAHRAYVLDHGKVIIEGDAQKVASGDILERIFMGTYKPTH